MFVLNILINFGRFPGARTLALHLPLCSRHQSPWKFIPVSNIIEALDDSEAQKVVDLCYMIRFESLVNLLEKIWPWLTSFVILKSPSFHPELCTSGWGSEYTARKIELPLSLMDSSLPCRT